MAPYLIPLLIVPLLAQAAAGVLYSGSYAGTAKGDTLVLTPQGGATISIRSAGQACYLTGQIGQGLVLKAEGLEKGAPGCELQFAPQGTGVVIHDTGGRCRQIYCGERGIFEGLTFAPVGK